MNILIIPGWLMNKNSFSKTEHSLMCMGHWVDVFECPGIDTKDNKVSVNKVLSLLRKTIRDGDYDVVIAHSYAVNWLLQMKSLLVDKKVILLSPCSHNCTKLVNIAKNISILLLVIKEIPLPKKLLRYIYGIVHTSSEVICEDMIDGYFTCSAVSAYRLLLQTLGLTSNESRIADADVLIVHGTKDRLVRCDYSSIIKQFKDFKLVKIDCGHDTFNHLPNEAILFMNGGNGNV